jgi:hypothetical protein
MSGDEDKGEHRTNAEDVKEILTVVSERVPALLNSLTDVLYGKSSAEKYGLAVSNFYATLKKSGMTDDQAFRLTEQYMSSLNLGQIIAKAVGGERGHHGEHGEYRDEGEDIARTIEEKLKGKRDEH